MHYYFFNAISQILSFFYLNHAENPLSQTMCIKIKNKYHWERKKNHNTLKFHEKRTNFFDMKLFNKMSKIKIFTSHQ